MKRVFLSLATLGALMLVLGCIRPVAVHKGEPTSPAAVDTSKKSPPPYDPVQLGGDVFEEELLREKGDAPQKVFGYRIQIAAVTDETTAQTLRTQAVSRLGPQVYVVRAEPFWCVRFGDFQTMEEAEDAKKSVLTKGYKDAWIIEDKIFRRE
ncbi:MAG: SPOR domain-containing protein [bacterium]